MKLLLDDEAAAGWRRAVGECRGSDGKNRDKSSRVGSRSRLAITNDDNRRIDVQEVETELLERGPYILACSHVTPT